MKKAVFAVFMSVCVLFSGCRGPETQEPTLRVVTAVSVVKNAQPIRSYSSPEKMITLLNYLRLLRPKFPAPEEAETENAPVYEITLHYSDGSQTIYRQKGIQYMQANGEGWKKIDPKFAWALEPMVKLMPGDS